MISLEKRENSINVIVVGQLEYDTSEELLDIVKTKLLISNVKNVNIDLSRVNYVNSIGIGTIVTIFKLLKEKNKSMSLLNPQDNVYKVLKLTKINEVINVETEGGK